MEQMFLYIIIALGLSIIVNILLKKIGISPIIGYIITGTIIVYAFDLKKVAHSHALEMVGDFGIILLMFTIGLEISLNKMGNMKQEIFGNGVMQVAFSSLVSYSIFHYIFDISVASSIVIALAFSLSSTAVVLSYLKSSKEIYTPYGQKATGILIFQDIAVIPILILIGFLRNEGNEGVAVILEHTLFSAILVLFPMFTIGKYLVTWLLHFSASSKLDELFMGSVLFIVMSSSLFASYMGFTYSLGAFIGGMIIAETQYHHKVEADIAPFKDILLGIFFVVVGMKIDVSMFLQNIGTIVALFMLILAVKSLIIFALLRLTSKSATSLKTALALSQVGEFALVIFAVASAGGIIESSIASLLVLVVIFSMIVTPFFISKISDLVDKIIQTKDVVIDMTSLESRKNHVIVCGYSIVGKFVTHDLEELGVPFVVVDNSNKHVKEALNQGLEAYLGDASKSQILHALNIEKASAIIVTLDNIDKKRVICEAILKYAKNANLIVKVTSLEEKKQLEDLDITMIVDGKAEVARVLVERMLNCQLK